MKKDTKKTVRITATITYAIDNEAARDLVGRDDLDLAKPADLKRALKEEVENAKRAIEVKCGELAPFGAKIKIKIVGEIVGAK